MPKTRWTVVGVFLALLAVFIVGCAIALTDLSDQATVSALPSREASRTGPVVEAASPDVKTVADKWSLWTGGTKLRGANIYQRNVYPELDGTEFMGPGPVGPPYTQADFNRLASLGANYVNISHPGLFTDTAPYVLDVGAQANLDDLLTKIEQANMFAVISFRCGPGRSPFTFFWDEVDDWFDASYLNDSMWQSQAAQDAWVAMWRYTAERYKDNPIVAGYDLMVEPNSNEVGSHALDDPLDIWDPDEFETTYGGTLYDWNQLYPRIVTAIREVDTKTPILVGGNGYSGVDWLPHLDVLSDPRMVYMIHQYDPHNYTHQWDSTACSYPGLCDLDWDGEDDDQLNKAWLESLFSTVDDFVSTHGVPVASNEFGAVRYTPGVADFMDDQMDLMEKQGMNHALWVWNPAWEPWTEDVDDFDFLHGPDPDNHSEVIPNDLMDVVLKYWGRNTVRPEAVVTETSYLPYVATGTAPSGPPSTGPLPLDEIEFWAYQIQAVAAPGAVDALAATHYDMLVLEPTRTDWSSENKYFDTAGMVSRLKNSKASDGQHRKLIIAYIDIGEAEDWRWYWYYWDWSTEWDCKLPTPSDWPDYILECDPDGWVSNYPVAYWDEDWKDIIIYGQNQDTEPGRDYVSAIDEAIKSGFDGIYLDWVEGWENTAVQAAAQAAGVDPAAEMIAFIGEMRTYARARDPDFLIIQQNAAELIDGRPQLLNVIDAIAQEAIWYDGDATDNWNDLDGYDWVNEKGLTDYYLEFLAHYQDAGLPVFDCEYALNYASQAYSKAYAEGFVPYATRRSLGNLTTTPPPDY